VLADGGFREGIILAEIDVNMVENTRNKLPSLHHDREFI
jgi:predicted amidohydrolase